MTEQGLLIHRKQSRFATCSLTREGFCKPSFSAIDERAAVISPKPSPVEKVDRPSLYAKVETDEVFASGAKRKASLRREVDAYADGGSCAKLEFYLSIRREPEPFCAATPPPSFLGSPSMFAKQTRQSLRDMPGGSLFVRLEPKGFRRQTEVHFVTEAIFITSPSAYASTSPRGEALWIFASRIMVVAAPMSAYGSSFCNRNDLGRPMVAPTGIERKPMFRQQTDVHFVTVTTSGDRWSPLRARYIFVISATDGTKM